MSGGCTGLLQFFKVEVYMLDERRGDGMLSVHLDGKASVML